MRAMGHIWSDRDDFETAALWYGRAARFGDEVAMFHLAWIYEEFQLKEFIQLREPIGESPQAPCYTPRSIPTDDIDAMMIELQEMADETESCEPVRSQSMPTGKDRQWRYAELAEYWYRRSAAKGFAPSMNNLGQLYLSTTGPRQDFVAAFQWHSAAAKSGNPVGHWNVGVAHLAGHGVEQSQAEAEKWYTWFPDSNLQSQLASPILERTRLFGITLSDDDCISLRKSAEQGLSVTMRLEALKPDPSLPTFKNATEALLQDQG